jgi:hypothetical protein
MRPSEEEIGKVPQFKWNEIWKKWANPKDKTITLIHTR